MRDQQFFVTWVELHAAVRQVVKFLETYLCIWRLSGEGDALPFFLKYFINIFWMPSSGLAVCELGTPAVYPLSLEFPEVEFKDKVQVQLSL